jgi:hypothetical protein
VSPGRSIFVTHSLFMRLNPIVERAHALWLSLHFCPLDCLAFTGHLSIIRPWRRLFAKLWTSLLEATKGSRAIAKKNGISVAGLFLCRAHNLPFRELGHLAVYEFALTPTGLHWT